VNVGDKVSEGSVILLIDSAAAALPAAASSRMPAVSPPPAPAHAPAGIAEVRVPDIGEFENVPVIEVLVKPGDKVKPEDPLVTLESDKATMDVPSPAAGVVKELRLQVGDKVSQGVPVLTLEAADGTSVGAPATDSRPAAAAERPETKGSVATSVTPVPSATGASASVS